MAKEKATLAEKRDNQIVPTGTFEEKQEPLLQLLYNPLKQWNLGSVFTCRRVLKLAFADRINCDRN